LFTTIKVKHDLGMLEGLLLSLIQQLLMAKECHLLKLKLEVIN
jgi:hypothetical protein